MPLPTEQAFVCQFDVEGLQPGCEGSSALFVSMWKQNWALIAQYCLPSIIITLISYSVFRFLESRHTSNHTARVQQVLAKTLSVQQLHRSLYLSAMLRATTQWTHARLGLACFTLCDLVYLTICTITLKAFLCVELEGAYRLHAEKSQLCWSHDHLPIGIFSLLVFPLLLLYPVFIYNYMQDCRESLKNALAKRRLSERVSVRVSARVPVRADDGTGLEATCSIKGGQNRSKVRSKDLKKDSRSGAVAVKAGGLSGRTFRDKYKPIGMAYAPVFRLCLSIFVSVPLPSALYRLFLASLPLLFFGFTVVNRPFETPWMNACNACLAHPFMLLPKWLCNFAHGLSRPLQGMR
jgi:hypothetical protein